jgi:hypothetical protein
MAVLKELAVFRYAFRSRLVLRLDGRASKLRSERNDRGGHVTCGHDVHLCIGPVRSITA